MASVERDDRGIWGKALVAIPLIVAAAIGALAFAQLERDALHVRIAIMPFKASIAEWILEDLATIAGDSAGVVGPTTTAAYGSSDADLRRLASDYRIDYIVNGRDLSAGDGPVLLAELIRTSDGVHVWVQPYEDLSDARRLGKEISGVVGSYEATRQTILNDVADAVGILAIISLSLAIVNLFPFLPLDGGHIFWAIVEKVRRKPVPFAVMERAGVVGFMLVILIFLIGLSNDIGRLSGEGFQVR